MRRIVQVTSVREAIAARDAGADAIIAKGSEAGGRIGGETAFVLLQELIREIDLPIWVQGGIGTSTAAACIAGGAAGVVLDSQLALLEESALPTDLRRVIAAMDGSETALLHGHRVYSRPGLKLSELSAAELVERFGSAGLDSNVLPAGADAAFAAILAEEFGSVARFVPALELRIDEQLQLAAQAPLLDQQSAFAKRHGTGAAIAQGPMTRVSDSPAFARAVSEAGGLPFLALAVMSGAETRRLLTEAAETLEGRTWGVGILGFVPPELQQQQLEAIEAIRPPVALIAGGRPEQAAKLEALGITTYLHVPSPGLLDLFLKQGARHFVFEGQECGGHIGPRSSFVLWEQQVRRLMRFERPEELSVLFAGGIHDARSAAMVSALAAPLAAKGASVGVLMGTAYLFTEELVTSGALQPLFQQTALECDRTVLLETAPGHITRCADTPYVRAFEAERDRLVAAGLPKDQIWVALEELNLGRLRIAAKGIVREGSELISVDPSVQQREGMVMLGQVATLGQRVQTIGELHSEVAAGSFDLLRQSAADELVGHPHGFSQDVAIVGMSVILPGAADIPSYWSNIVNGVNSITEVPPERWNAELFFDSESKNGDMTPSKWGGFIDAVEFDPLAYGIPPKSLAAIEPVQLLALEVSRRALQDAGYDSRPFDRDRASVIFGAEGGGELAGGYGFRALWRQYVGDLPDELDDVLPVLTEDSFPGILGNVIAGRIANRLDLGGVNYTVDAACASALAAVDLAVKELSSQSSDLVICGGADLHNGITDYLAFASVHALSPTGQCKPMDAAADGIALGEGVAAIVLKRLSDAQRDGDRIYAVIKGVAGGSDGKSLGLTAPRQEGQVRTLHRAYQRAGVSPASVGLIEAHGTGTVVGDRTELETLTEVFRGAGAAAESCALGSVKSQIGHTKCTAGLAGLIKAALALHYRVLPPTLNVQSPNPGWTPSSPFVINTEPRPWPGLERFAGVSAFGFGGTNFHAVLASYDAGGPPQASPAWPSELLLFRGPDEAEAMRTMDAVRAALVAGVKYSLGDLAKTVSTMQGPVQFAIVASSLDDLRASLQTNDGVYPRPKAPLAAEGKLAFLFPGQGSQKPGMLADLFIHFASLQRYLELGERWRDIMLPPPAWSRDEVEAQKRTLTDTRNAQPSLGIAGLAAYDLLSSLGITPEMLGGHSYGELIALSAAGAFSPRDLLTLSEARAAAIADCVPEGGDPGSMAAALSDIGTIRGLIEGISGVVIANQNAPDQNVLSGATSAVAEARARLKEAGIRTVELPVSSAFHSPIVAPATAAFSGVLDHVHISPPRRTVYSNTTAEPYPDEPGAIKQRLVEHIPSPVRFADEVLAMYEAGARIFVEVGPGQTLTGLAGRILGGHPHLAVAIDQGGPHALSSLLAALAQLAVNGVELDVEQLFAGRNTRVVDLDARPAPKPTSWMLNGQMAIPVSGALPAHSMKQITGPVLGAAALSRGASTPALIDREEPAPTAAAESPVNPAAAPTLVANGLAAIPDQRAAVVLAYLENLRELADAQNRALMAYLGDGPPVDTSSQQALKTALGQPPSPQPAQPQVQPLHESLNGNGAGVSHRDHRGNSNGIANGNGAAPTPARIGVSVENSRDTSVAVASGFPSAGSVAAAPRASVLEMLVSLVSERTGYPAEMLDLDLDLEADLSIDSIKRVEIVGALIEQLAPGATATLMETPDDLVRMKSLREIGAAVESAFITAGPVEQVPGTSSVDATAPVMPPVTPSVSIEVAPPVDLLAMLTDIVSERTGYPLEMLDPDLDLEADLSIDSIKRVEIVGAVLDQVIEGGTAALAETPDELVRLKTLREIAAAMETAFTAGAPRATAEISVAAATPSTASAPSVAAAAPAQVTPAVDLAATLVAIVSERTGYPPEMLDLDLDLEADLSIDSIKRIEILAALAEAMGRTDTTTTELPDEIVRLKTLRAILAAFAEIGADATTAAPDITVAAAAPPRISGTRPERYVPRFVATGGAPEVRPLTDMTVAIATPDEALLRVLSTEVTRLGGAVATDASTVNAVVDVSGLATDWSPLRVPETFERLKQALLAGASRILVVTGDAAALVSAKPTAQGRAAGGLAGLVKSLAREWPERMIRVIHLEHGIDAPDVAQRVCAELGEHSDLDEVVYTGNVRRVRRVVQRDLEDTGNSEITLDQQSVILITGGARGITSAIAAGLAKQYQCTFELVGRTKLDTDPLEAQVAHATDLPSLRRALVSLGESEISSVDAIARRILGSREVRETLAAIESAGGTVSYTALDIRDQAAFGALIDSIYERRGRIDGVIHAAGVIDDRLASDKTIESFERVFLTKVEPAQVLASRVHPDARFVAFFSSVAAVFGSRGQTDYAAANDVLDRLAAQMNGESIGRVFSVNWGPWAGGMMSPELVQEYRRRGVDVIEPRYGVEAFLDELRSGAADDVQVMLMSGASRDQLERPDGRS